MTLKKSRSNQTSRQSQDWHNSKTVSKKNPCPACGKTDWCTFDGTGEWLLCRRAGSTPSGWIFVKTTATGLSLFRKETFILPIATIADLKSTAPAASEPEPAPEPIIECNQVELNHAVYSDLLAALGLRPVHLKELTDLTGKRRLTLAQIQAMNLKSVPTGKNAFDAVLAKLVNKYGQQLKSVPGFYFDETGQAGLNAKKGSLLIPSCDGQYITGIEVATSAEARAKNPDLPKYIRLTSASDWLKERGIEGPKAVLKASVYQPLNSASAGRVGVTEGAFKAFIAAQLLGYPVIAVPGVSNWQHGAVELALKQAGLNGQVTVFYDADAARNRFVENAKIALAEGLHTAGLKVELAEWPENAGKGIDDLLLAGGAFSTYAYVPGLAGLKVDRLLDTPKLDYVPVSFDKKFSLIRSAKGTGKTHWLSSMIKLTLAKGGRVLVIGHRVSLLKEAARRHNLAFYQDFNDAEKQEELSKQAGLAICLDSLIKLKLDKLSKLDLVVIDESEQALNHLTGSTIRDKRQPVMSYLAWLLNKADKVLFLDADISPISYNYLARQFGKEQIEIITNIHRPAPKTFIRYESKAALLKQVETALSDNRRIFIAVNSRRLAKVLGKVLTTHYPEKKGWVIHSHSVTSTQEQAKIERINQTIVNYDYVVASPTLGTGVSIDVSSIDSVFVFAETGVNTHLDLMQQAARVRQPVSKQVHVWINPRKMSKETNPAIIKQWAIENIEETGIAINLETETGQRLAQPGEQQYLNLLADITAAKHTSWKDLSGNFWQQVTLEGHTIIDAGELSKKEHKEITAQLNAGSEEIDLEHAESVISAPEITETEYLTLKDKKNKSDSDRYKIQRYSLQSFYGLEVTEKLIDQDNEGRTRPKVINFLAFCIDGYALERDRNEFSKALDSDKLLADCKNLHAKTELRMEVLEQAGLLSDMFATFTLDSLKASKLNHWLETNRNRVARLLEINVKSEQALTRLVTGVLKQLGLKLSSRQYRTGRMLIDESGQTIPERDHEYWLDKEYFGTFRELARAHLAASKSKFNLESDTDNWNLAA